MAIGISSRWQGQLRTDLASGAPIPYRRVPGQPRLYYNPRTGQEVSEHYVVRIYRPALEESQRLELRRQSNIQRRQQNVQLNSIADTWRARQEALGTPVTSTNLAKKNAEFQTIYQRFKRVSYEARHAPIEDTDSRTRLYAADGEYAQLLVLLGRRLPDAGFPVGESAAQVGAGGSYINEVVLPALRG